MWCWRSSKVTPQHPFPQTRQNDIGRLAWLAEQGSGWVGWACPCCSKGSLIFAWQILVMSKMWSQASQCVHSSCILTFPAFLVLPHLSSPLSNSVKKHFVVFHLCVWDSGTSQRVKVYLSISQPLLFSSFLRYSHCYTVLPWAGQNNSLKHAQGGNLSWGGGVWYCACGCFNQVGRGLCFA